MAVWARTESVRVGDLEVTVRSAGAGVPLVLLHGGLGSGEDWTPVVEALGGSTAVHVPDSRGHGSTRGPGDRLEYAAMADDVAALIAALGLDRPVVAGWSDGGNIALELGLRHPDRARALVVAGAWIRLDEHMQRLNRDVFGMTSPGVVDRERLEANGLLARAVADSGRTEAEVLATVAALSHAYTTDPALDGRLGDLTVPTLVVLGDRDPFVPLEHAVDLYRALPEAALAIVPGGAHDLPREHSDALARLIGRQLAR